MNLMYKPFKAINISDPFFDSLKHDYAEFNKWFASKSDDYAYVFTGEKGAIDGFLYLKPEIGPVKDVTPPLYPERRIKIGTFKVNPHGTKLGERFLKKIFDHAVTQGVSEIYLTVFKKHESLITLLNRYGFQQEATKTTVNGTELVLVKSMNDEGSNILDRYPLVKIAGNSIYLLSLYPNWHTRLLPDSILRNEDASIVQDVSHTNSIHKVYLAAMHGMEAIQPGDIILIYRTSDRRGPAHYRSVVTSVCVIEEYNNICSFSSKEEFLSYCSPYSVFTVRELEQFWTSRRYPHILRFTYNFALPKRVTRGKMIEEIGFGSDNYWGFMKLSNKQFRAILSEGKLNESLVLN